MREIEKLEKKLAETQKTTKTEKVGADKEKKPKKRRDSRRGSSSSSSDDEPRKRRDTASLERERRSRAGSKENLSRNKQEKGLDKKAKHDRDP